MERDELEETLAANGAAGRAARPWIRYLPVVATFAAGLVVTAVVFRIARQGEQGELQAEFFRLADDRITAIHRAIDTNLTVLPAIGALYEASLDVDRDEFAAFVAPLLARHQGIQALKWIPRVSDAERAEFEEGARQAGIGGFRVWERTPAGESIPAQRRGESFPVYYVEPFDSNAQEVGFDVASELTLLEILQRSRDSREITASPRVHIRPQVEQTYGVSIALPKYPEGRTERDAPTAP